MQGMNTLKIEPAIIVWKFGKSEILTAMAAGQ